MGTVRGRVGYAFDQVLIYGTGGYAWADNRMTASSLGVSVSDSHIHSGWTVGAGVEVMFAPKWSVKAEYLYRSFAERDLQLPRHHRGRRCERNAQPEQRSGRCELSLLRLPAETASASVPIKPERRRLCLRSSDRCC